jgi:choline-sulfatase
LISFVDAQVGLILDTLEELDLEKKTLVLYTSDHGDSAGARGLWGKFNFFEESAKVPMILAGPGVPTANTCETPVSLIDCHATILDGLGVARYADDDAHESRSLFELAVSADEPDRIILGQYHAFASPSGGFMLRKGRYKYHYYVGYPPELFDLHDDPQELHDLAGDPAHAATLAQMEALLRQRLDPEAVDAIAKADQAKSIERFGGADAAVHTGAPGTTPVPGYSQE